MTNEIVMRYISLLVYREHIAPRGTMLGDVDIVG